MTAAVLKPTKTLIANSRIYKAPRELVFRMFTDAEHISSWWGPRGFTTKTTQMDVRPGGLWKHTMISAEGVEYANEVRYKVVNAPSQIIYEHINDPLFTATINFTELASDRTEVDFTLDFHDEKLRDGVAKNGAVEGLHDTLTRFEEVLGTLGGEEFLLTRELNAPRELVYKSWVEPARLEQWFGPVGKKISIKKADMRVGGQMVYGMQAPDGEMWWGRWIFRDLTPYSRIAFILSFVDENENAIPHPMMPAMPVEMFSTTTFEERDGKTIMTLRSRAMHATDEQKQTFFSIFKGMEQGWGGTIKQLEGYLAAQ